MVGDDHIDPRLAESSDGSNRGGSAIAGDYDARLRGDGRIDSGIAQVVSVLYASRDERLRLAAESTYGAGEERSRRDTVYVVIAMYEHKTLVTHCAREPINCFVHRQKQQRVVQLIELGTQKELGVLGAHVSANEQQSTDDLRQRQRLGEILDRLFVGRLRENPARRTRWASRCERRHSRLTLRRPRREVRRKPHKLLSVPFRTSCSSAEEAPPCRNAHTTHRAMDTAPDPFCHECGRICRALAARPPRLFRFDALLPRRAAIAARISAIRSRDESPAVPARPPPMPASNSRSMCSSRPYDVR